MNRGKPQKYLSLAQEILKTARNEGLSEGGKLASERTLAERYGCTHLTVRKALKVLAGQGHLHTVPGKGSYLGPAGPAVSSDRFGFIFPDDEIFYYRIFAEVERVASSRGLHPVVHLTGGSARKENDLLTYFEQSGIRVLIAVPNRECIEHYRTLKIPILLFDVPLPGLDVPQIVSDDYSGAFEAVTRLIQAGHIRIAHIGSNYDCTGEQRLKGYLSALEQAALPCRRQLIRLNYPSREWGYHAARELFGLKHPPTAVFCANDTIAAGVMSFCADRGTAVPEELSVVGFGNTPTAEYLNLNSVSQNEGKISAALCSNLHKLLNHIEIPELTVIPTVYVVRKSTAPRKIAKTKK